MLSLEENLEGKILIASPTLDSNSYFSRAVIYILRNSIDGSIGLMINQPLPKFGGNLAVKHEGETISLNAAEIYSGGPLDTNKGFVLHFDKHAKLESDHLIKLNFDIKLLKALAKGRPSARNSLFLFGYCGWSRGQLEEELRDNYWLVAPPNKRIIFDIKNSYKWDKYLNLLNINPVHYIDRPGTC